MKKIISIVFLIAMISLLFTTVVNAETTTSNNLADELYELGAKYGLNAGGKVEIERFIRTYNVTDNQAAEIYAKATEAVSDLQNAGITDIKDVTPELKSQLIEIANEAAGVVGAKVTLTNGKAVVVGKDGKVFTTVSFDNGTLAYTGADTLADEIYAIGAQYGLSGASKVEIERFVKQYKVTDDQANSILQKANAAAQVMKDAGVTDVSNLKEEEKNELISIANSAADVVGAKLTFNNNNVVIVGNDGRTFTTVTFDNGTLTYTGNNVNMVLIVSSIVVIALAIAIVTVAIKKRLSVNA